jgi:hypothetical protein
MPLLWRTVDPALLRVPFRAAIERAFAPLTATYVATWGVRTADEQNAIAGQGRTVGELIALGMTPADARRFAAPTLPRVSNAIAGMSAHNWGCAIDICVDADPVKPGLQPDWTPTADTDPITPGDQPDGWIQLRERLAQGFPELRSGGDWGDLPHIEWRQWRKIRAARRTTTLAA